MNTLARLYNLQALAAGNVENPCLRLEKSLLFNWKTMTTSPLVSPGA